MSYVYYKKLTIDHTKVGSTLTDYPLTVVINSDNNLRTTGNSGKIENTVSGGASGSVTIPADLIFSLSVNGTKLDHEVEKYSATTGELIAHVRISSLVHDEDTIVYMCYGDSSVTTSQENINGVWDDDYVGVWHLGEGGGTSYDSTSNSFNASDHASASGTDGQIGNGQEFDGSDDYYQVPDDTLLDLTAQATISFWAKKDSNENYQAYVTKNNGLAYQMLDKATTGKVCLRWGEDSDTLETVSAVSTGSWHLLTGVYTGSNIYLYVDGSESNSGNWATDATENNVDVYFGRRPDGFYFNGHLDEIRISSVSRSADWVSTTYNNQFSPSTFYTLGTQQNRSISGAVVLDSSSIEDAKVFIITSGGLGFQNTTTNASGNYLFRGCIYNTYNVFVTYSGSGNKYNAESYFDVVPYFGA